MKHTEFLAVMADFPRFEAVFELTSFPKSDSLSRFMEQRGMEVGDHFIYKGGDTFTHDEAEISVLLGVSYIKFVEFRKKLT